MPPWNVPLPRAQQPTFGEGSALASNRDSRNNSLLWRKVKNGSGQNEDYGRAIQSLSREVQRMKRRIVGGGQQTNIFGVNVQTANYTASDSDSGQLISFSSSSALTLTLPSTPPSPNWAVSVECVGSGGLSISPNGLTIDGASGNLTLSQNQGVMIFTDGSNYFTQRGIGSTPSVQYYAINTLYNADYMQAFPVVMAWNNGSSSWSATLLGAVYIAKLNRMRPSVGSELIDGVTINYSNYTLDNTRTASDGTNTEYQVAFPRYTTLLTLGITDNSNANPIAGSVFTSTKLTALLNCQAFIKATPPLGGCGIKGYTGLPIYVEEITPRVWARRYTQ